MISAIVLAAGESRRMGEQKLLLPFGSTTVVEHIVSRLLESRVDEVVVVVGCDGERVSKRLAERRVVVAENEDYQRGMLSSVRIGLQSASRDAEGYLIALGDHPSISPRVVDTVVEAFRSSVNRGESAAGKRIFVPTFEGKRGHPLLFSVCYKEAVLTGYEDVGLRGLMHDNAGAVEEVAVETETILDDMDTPEDYRRLSGAFRPTEDSEN